MEQPELAEHRSPRPKTTQRRKLTARISNFKQSEDVKEKSKASPNPTVDMTVDRRGRQRAAGAATLTYLLEGRQRDVEVAHGSLRTFSGLGLSEEGETSTSFLAGISNLQTKTRNL